MSDDDDRDDELTDPRGDRSPAPAAQPEPPARPSWDKRLDRATWDRLMGRGERPGPIITGDPLLAPPGPVAPIDDQAGETAALVPPGPPWDRRITREDWERLFDHAAALPALAPEAPLAEGSGWMHNSDAFAKLAIADGSSWDNPLPSGVDGPAESSEFPEIRVEAPPVVVDVAVAPAGPREDVAPPLASDLVTTAPAHRSLFSTSVPARLPSDFVTTLSISEGLAPDERPGLDDAAELGVTDVPADEPGASRPHFISRDQIELIEAAASGALPDDAVVTWQQLRIEELEEISQATDLDERVTSPAPRQTLDEPATTRAARDRIPEDDDDDGAREAIREAELSLDRPPPPAIGVAVAVRRPADEPAPDDGELHRRAMRRAVFGTASESAARASRSDGRETRPNERARNDVAGRPQGRPSRGEAVPRDDHDTVRVERVDDDTEDDGDKRGPGGGGKAKAGTLLAVFAIVILVAALASCARPPEGVVLWHAYNGVEREALEASAARWNAAHPEAQVELVAVPYSAFGDKLTSAIPGGNGPDLFIYSQDRIGDWAGSSIIEPIEFWLDDAKLARFSEPAVAAMAYGGSLYGLPLATKSLALFYRTDVVATPPATTDELLALAPRMKAKRGYAIAYANVDLYGHAPWLFGFGGRIMRDDGALDIATPESANAMSFARELVATGAAPDHAEGPLVATLFNEGKAATAVSGPWFVADIKDGVPWKVATLPIVSATGTHASPFLGAEGILMSARARDKATAFAVMDALVSDENATERARRARQVVPNLAAYDDPEVARDAALNAFRAQLVHTVPMPKSAGMRMVWTPYKTALGEVLAGRAEPAQQLRSVEREVQKYLDGRAK